MIWTVLALIGMGILASFGSFFLKRAASGGFTVSGLLRSPDLYIGGILYVGASVLNIYLLKVLPYSIVLPLGSMTYVWTLLISRFLLRENVNRFQVLGVSVILCGIVLVALSV